MTPPTRLELCFREAGRVVAALMCGAQVFETSLAAGTKFQPKKATDIPLVSAAGPYARWRFRASRGHQGNFEICVSDWEPCGRVFASWKEKIAEKAIERLRSKVREVIDPPGFVAPFVRDGWTQEIKRIAAECDAIKAQARQMSARECNAWLAPFFEAVDEMFTPELWITVQRFALELHRGERLDGDEAKQLFDQTRAGVAAIKDAGRLAELVPA